VGDRNAGGQSGLPPFSKLDRASGPKIVMVSPPKRPTLEDRHDAARAALAGIAAGTDPVDLARQLETFHPERYTFPAEVFLDLAADALDISGASRDHPVDYSGIRERYLSEVSFRGKTQHHRSHYALRAVAMMKAGVDPDLLDEVSWWHSDDLWLWSLYALYAYVRVATERTGDNPAKVCTKIATRHQLILATQS
jgi:hypothetical protein